MAYVRLIRICISSPGDVNDERAIALEEIEKLVHRPVFRERVSFRIIAWDKKGAGTVMRAKMTPQEAINKGFPAPSQCDIVVTIFWSRMGTPFTLNGRAYLSGTHYELLDALEAERPEVVIYQRTEKKIFDPDSATYDADLQQYRTLQDFLKSEVFYDPTSGEIRRSVTRYATPEDFRQEFATNLEELVAEILARDEAHPPKPERASPEKQDEAITDIQPKPWPGSPFPGLRAFAEADAPIFFGRGRETDALVRLLAGSRFVGAVGASGSGKSSLVGAGLLPRLRANAISSAGTASKDWLIARFTPGKNANPFEALAEALMTVVPALQTADPIDYPERLDKLSASLAALQKPDRLMKTVEQALKDAPAWAEVLLFIDQFEELFTLVSAEARAAFAKMLAQAVHSQRIRIVVTIRHDFSGRCAELPALAGLMNAASYYLPPPNPQALQSMIERPAERAGLTFEDGLIERILEDTGSDPGSLALMAYALDELYQMSEARSQGQITWADYRQLDGVAGAIGARAQKAFDALDGEAQTTLGQVFRELVAISDEEQKPTRKRARLSEAAPDLAALRLVEALTQARLLVQSGGQGEAWVEVAHEALFRSWPGLAAWIEETRGDLYLLDQLRKAAALWQSKNRGRDYLWLAERGLEMQAMLERLKPKLTETEKAFARPEQDHLLDELDDPATPHLRRDQIGQRLNDPRLGDGRPGVGTRRVGSLVIPDILWCRVEVPPGASIKIEGQAFPLQPFYIARYLVTHAQFQSFLDDPEGFRHDRWWRGMPEEAKAYGTTYRVRQLDNQLQPYASYPRDTVTWYQSVAFARWLDQRCCEDRLFETMRVWDKQTRQVISVAFDGESSQVRLPTEWEWEWAARGGKAGSQYPWGEWKEGRANTSEAGINHSTAVGMYPSGEAGCGARDMAGNLWEWCLNNYKDITNVNLENGTKVLRGGSFLNNRHGAACGYRSSSYPSYGHSPRRFSSGLRVVLSFSVL